MHARNDRLRRPKALLAPLAHRNEAKEGAVGSRLGAHERRPLHCRDKGDDGDVIYEEGSGVDPRRNDVNIVPWIWGVKVLELVEKDRCDSVGVVRCGGFDEVEIVPVWRRGGPMA